MRSRSLSLCATSLVAVFGIAFGASAAPMFMGVGDLPGNSFASRAYAVSADGSVAVGWSISASGGEAFRWTSAGGMVGLGDLPGGGFFSEAFAVSADGLRCGRPRRLDLGHRGVSLGGLWHLCSR